MKIFLIILSLAAHQVIYSQKSDTLKKYLDGNFFLTSRKNMVYPALAFRSNDRWILYAAYPDNAPLLIAYFKDKDLEVFDGPYTVYYPNKNRARSGHYQDGYRRGVWRYWYSNGRLRDSGIIINDQLVGTWYTWHDNGKLLLSISYASGENPGNAKVKAKISLPKRSLITGDDELTGFKDGGFIKYRPDGSISDSGQFINNRKAGLWKTWFDNGQLEAAGHFSNDSLQGEWTWYRDNGVVATKENYRDNKLVSLQCFDETGKYTGEYCSILKPPVPLGDFTDFENYMLDNIIMPKELRNTPLEGTVTIRCNITKAGKLTTINIDGCRYESLRKEIEKFFLGIKEWSPAILHNRPMDYAFEYVLPLSIPE